MNRLHHAADAVASAALVAGVRCYQWLVSPWLGPRCRYQPSCSEYSIQAIRKYGAVGGGWRSLKRIARCHPWGGGGYDPP